ncbi:ABC transporter permease subunit [Geodermatophilus sp. URMC 62]|uniref:ABC transporter permease subunit n=1 Tax=Geodermatophilus sp. URMC 62 TaxID=3423414 RepID=UPI00406D1306
MASTPTLPTVRRPGRIWVVVGILVAWVGLHLLLRGQQTLALAPADLTPLHRDITEFSDSVSAGRDSNPLFLYGFDQIREAIDAFVTLIRDVIVQPSFGRPVPVLGWLGVVALGTFLAAVAGSLRAAVLVAAGLVFIGTQGLWTEAMDTLALTIASVVISLLFGIPLGVWAGMSTRVGRVVTPVLDFMQTMPSFVYLVPLTLFFLIGPASATIATTIYAAPPVIRLTAHAVRNAPAGVVEAATSLGADRWQTLRTVRLPLARRLIVTGVNQTIMAALSMATVAALINAPGLGQTVLQALETLDVGVAFNAGLAIVVLAILLDRATTAVSVRTDATQAARRAGNRTVRRAAVAGGLLATLFAIWLSRTYLWAAEFPGGSPVGPWIVRTATDVSDWLQTNLSVLTLGLKDALTGGLINPLQSLLTDSPWWVVFAALAALAAVVGGLRAVAAVVVCLGLVIGLGLWGDAMTTLAATLIATVLTMVIAVVLGVAMGRSRRADAAVRPVLDAAQTMPSFVYLVPFLALFAASRFTAIVAAVVYAVPVATKIIADGVRAVPAETVEAATAAGSTRWQIIRNVQLPMSRHAIALATNQGLIYVLAMVVVGGLVGAGALGYDVVAGFSQAQLYGKGLAAGMAIVLLGIMLDRVTQAAAARTGGARTRSPRAPGRRSSRPVQKRTPSTPSPADEDTSDRPLAVATER